jgi:dipeptidyl-peptidase-4
MKKILIILLLLTMASAQERMLSLENAVLDSRTFLAPQKLSHIHWFTDQKFCFADTVPGDRIMYLYDAASLQKKPWFGLQDIRDQISTFGDSLKTLPDLEWSGDSLAYFWRGKQCYTFAPENKSLKKFLKLSSSTGDKAIHANTGQIAFVQDDDLFLYKEKTGSLRIAESFHKNISYGQGAYRNEFGVSEGIFWSPGGRYVAFYEKDERNVTDYPIIDIDARPAKLKMIKYPMAGTSSERVRVMVYNTQTATLSVMLTGQPLDHYLTNVTWDPEDKSVYIVHLNRAQNCLRLVRYDPHSGEPVATLLQENDEKYIDLQHPPYFLPDQSGRFIWLSSRDGYRHAYLYDKTGRLLRQLTHGTWEITDFEGFDHQGRFAFVTGTAKSPLDRTSMRIDLTQKSVTVLQKESGWHSLYPAPDGMRAIESVESPAIPAKFTLVNFQNDKKSVLLSSNDPLKEYQMPPAKLDSFTIQDGTLLYTRTIYPPDFDPTKTYPAIVYVYNGPHVQLITRKWLYGAKLWDYYLAQEGYIVFTIDGRGSANRGLEFEQATFLRLGSIEIEDQLAGVRQLLAKGFVDSSRMGVYGWSYGGFMSTSLMTRKPGVFKVGVAGGPVIDWAYYEVMYTERYMSTPQTNEKGYHEANLLNYVDQLQGNLLLIHGTADPVVVWQHSLLYLQKAAEMNRLVDYMAYPGYEHHVTGDDRLHLYHTITEYFNRNL